MLQFHLLLRNWCSHSSAARVIPTAKLAIMSGYSLHNFFCELESPGMLSQYIPDPRACTGSLLTNLHRITNTSTWLLPNQRPGHSFERLTNLASTNYLRMFLLPYTAKFRNILVVWCVTRSLRQIPKKIKYIEVQVQVQFLKLQTE